ncbi:MAG: alpha/beta fold hydrolase [Gemmatimonadota bacterium]|nr:alpha/beta fold hydrolase [Gemmatimonadota bacterium]
MDEAARPRPAETGGARERIEARGVEFHVVHVGSTERPTAVFLHGLLVDNLASWYYALAGRVSPIVDVVLYDLRGHGKSDRPATGYTVDDMVADLDALLDALGIDEPVELVGNSFGGLLAVAYALAHPDRVRGLALLDPSLPDENWGEMITTSFALEGDERMEAIERYVPLRWPDQESRRRERRLRESARSFVRETTLVEDLARARPMEDEQLRSIEQPVLVLYGARSEIDAHAGRLASLLPNVETRYFPESTHLVLWEEASAVREIVAGWLSRSDPDRAELGTGA